MNGHVQGGKTARDKYTGFHWGRPPRKHVAVTPPPRPRELVELGRLEAVTYSTTKGKEGLQHYEHEFGEEGGRKPVLAVDPHTDRLHVIGGDYAVEDRGIVN
jgi:hypothetical protein